MYRVFYTPVVRLRKGFISSGKRILSGEGIFYKRIKCQIRKYLLFQCIIEYYCNGKEPS
jgi:hypothetical protein